MTGLQFSEMMAFNIIEQPFQYVSIRLVKQRGCRCLLAALVGERRDEKVRGQERRPDCAVPTSVIQISPKLTN